MISKSIMKYRKNEFEDDNYPSVITFSNKALRSKKNIMDKDLEILRYQLAISYSEEGIRKAAIQKCNRILKESYR